jgi:hypothetical protein
MKRVGPELKMPDLKQLKELKPPAFLADVYYDLRDRRLLPLVALVVVAIAAVPFLLGGDAEEPALPPAGEAVTAELEEEIAGSSGLTVVKASPGLRDYRKRLRRHAPTDPFKQRYTSLPKGAKLTSTVESISVTEVGGGGGAGDVTVTEVDTTVTEGDGGGSSPPAKRGGSGKADAPDDLDGRRLYGFRPDIRFGVAGSGDLARRDELPLGTLLPKKQPLVLFVGVTQNGKRAFFSVTRRVERVRGEGDCIGGKRDCQLLSLQAGQAVDLLTETPGRAFRLKVMRIDFVQLPIPKQAEQDASGSSVAEARPGWARTLSP